MSDTLPGLGGIFTLLSATTPAVLIWLGKKKPLPTVASSTVNSATDVQFQRLLAFSAPYACLYQWQHHLLCGDCNTATAIEILSDWGITSELDLVRHLNALTTSSSQFDRDLIAWDNVRLAFLCRCGYAAGWLGKFSTQRRLLAVANVLSSRFKSWEELAEHFLLGYGQWSTCLRYEGAMQRRVKKLQRDSDSPWQQLTWQQSDSSNDGFRQQSQKLGTNVLVLASAGG